MSVLLQSTVCIILLNTGHKLPVNVPYVHTEFGQQICFFYFVKINFNHTTLTPENCISNILHTQILLCSE